MSCAYMYYIVLEDRMHNIPALVLYLYWTYFVFIVLVIHKVVLHVIKRNTLEHNKRE